ncbi:DUF4411 family protein [Acinetobacter brisouii]
MSTVVKYLIDSNIFIDGHNRFYHPKFCDLFWDWLNAGFIQHAFFSIDKVKDEVTKPDPTKNELSRLISANRLPSQFFVSSLANQNLFKSYTEVISWSTNHNFYSSAAKEEFASSTIADAYLISVAKAEGYTIVTAETSQPHDKNRIRIPDAAKIFNVKTVRLDQLLKLHAEDNFKFKL